ncbi:cupin domain-containing protein [Gracilibacillus sp. S3-1-1]|uniref:Cupin domain-containing protein n=1 Tax=Gracilibacillus pellucidus TaxID=3095368 RepID=A0ACC6M794_9BACI|nr:cupin domain-containing protein [Gracilibacillus sp. S3-1-1]MDX8046728.1 cupin domain-containing protein [Gracilibacillus sp. S3-1-1]
MYYTPNIYPWQYQIPYYTNIPIYHHGIRPIQESYQNMIIEHANTNRCNEYRSYTGDSSNYLTDYGPNPFVININEATKQNNTYRTAVWTGDNLQVTLMSIDVGKDIGLEMHSDVDQFLRIEQGQGIIRMGSNKNNLDFERFIYDDSAIIIPAGTWHNLTNAGNIPLKLYSIYAPPNHPFGTMHATKADAIAAEEGVSINT